jgi:hypothetical protein
MSSALTTIGDLEIDDPGCIHHIREHLASGCPLEPLVEAVAPMPPEERAPLVAAMVAKANTLIAARNEAANDAQFPDMSRNSEDAPKRGRGRPKSVVATERRQLAEEAHVSERTIRRDAAKLEPAEVIAPKPPTMDKLFQEAHELLERARSILDPIKADIEALRGDFDKKDGRWALLGCVAQAANQARLGAEYVAQARGFREAMERAKHTKGGNKRPVGAFEVVKGQDLYEHSTHKQAADPEAMARGEQWRHKTEQDEAQARKESLRLSEESRRRREEAKPLGLSDPPKVGLKAPKRVTVVDEQDRPLLPPAEETANAWADAARVGVGPSEDDDAAF